jgi:hypothetical protein
MPKKMNGKLNLKNRMENIPFYISITFILITFITLGFFYFATNNSKTILIICLIWLILQAILGNNEFYLMTDTFPPRFLFLIAPPFLTIALLFILPKGKICLDTMNIKTLTLLHIIRIPVEIVLFWLFIHKTIPELMTFEGRNFDILSGITAPIIYYFGFIRKKLNTKIMIAWNILCLGLLLNIVINAILSAPLPFQQFAFDQPNIAVFYFPFNWLPGFIVPLVFLSHLVCIRQLLNTNLNHLK